VSELKTLFFSLRGELAESQQIEIDPALTLKPVAAATLGRITDGKSGQRLADELFRKDSSETQNLESKLRRSAGERIFSRAAIVIPIYPETTQHDIDWAYIERLKTELYGESYRPKENKYDKIVKIFERGELRSQKRAWKTWKEIGDSVGLTASATEFIYTRAYEVVYGYLPEKRINDGRRSSGERTTNTGEVDNYTSCLDPETDLCFKCDQFGRIATGRYPTPQQYETLSKYLSLPPHPGTDEPFICEACLSKIPLTTQ
jgi:hypothetical protein